jgi:gamma-glutamyl-gamma-aminobutyrate hydrolase PuuD
MGVGSARGGWPRVGVSWIEAAGEPFLIGVQFHPERPGEVPEMAGLFDALVSSGQMA